MGLGRPLGSRILHALPQSGFLPDPSCFLFLTVQPSDCHAQSSAGLRASLGLPGQDVEAGGSVFKSQVWIKHLELQTQSASNSNFCIM